MTVTASVSTAPFSRRDARRYRSRIVARYSCLACGPTRVPSWGTPVWVWPLVKTLVLLLTVSGLAQQACAPQRLAAARAALLDEFQSQRKSRVIAMIHRQETVSLLGVPVSSSIDI